MPENKQTRDVNATLCLGDVQLTARLTIPVLCTGYQLREAALSCFEADINEFSGRVAKPHHLDVQAIQNYLEPVPDVTSFEIKLNFPVARPTAQTSSESAESKLSEKLASLSLDPEDGLYASLPQCAIGGHDERVLPIKPDALFVRDSYLKIYTIITDNWRRERRENFLILGTPGVGKSSFIRYFVWKYLQTHPTTTFILNTGQGSFKRFEYRDGSLFSLQAAISKIVFWMDLRRTEGVVFITDGFDPELDEDCNAPTLEVSSPGRDQYKRFEKRDSTITLCMPTWSFEELQQAVRAGCSLAYQTGDSSEKLTNALAMLRRRYAVLGGTFRYVLTHLERTPELIMKDAVAKCSSLTKLLSGEEVTSGSKESHKAIHWILPPDDDSFLLDRRELNWASPYAIQVARELWKMNAPK